MQAPPPFREGTSSAGEETGILTRTAFSFTCTCAGVQHSCMCQLSAISYVVLLMADGCPYSCGTVPDFHR